MNATRIKQHLHRYIEQADPKRLKAIYTILEPEIGRAESTWTPEFTAEMDRRAEELDAHPETGIPWEEVQRQVGEVLAKVGKK